METETETVETDGGASLAQPRKKTEYLVFVKDAAESWKPIGSVHANKAVEAIRQIATQGSMEDTFPGIQEGKYAATPARSWVTREVQAQTRLTLL